MPPRKLLSEKIAEELERIEEKIDDIEPARVQKTISSAHKNLLEIKDRIAELEDLGAIKNKRRKSEDGKPVELSEYQKFVKRTFPKVKEENPDLPFPELSKIVASMWKKSSKGKKAATKAPAKKGKKASASDSEDSGSEFSEDVSDDDDDDDEDVKPKKKASAKKAPAKKAAAKGKAKKGGYYEYEYF